MFISKKDDRAIKVTKIDDIVKDDYLDDSSTIKMNVEGCELPAINGAKEN